MKYLIAIDSDGTLRHTDGSISKETKEIIKEIKDKGNIVIICTARPRYHTLRISNEVGIDDYIISSNGTEIFDNINKKVIYTTYINQEDCKVLYFKAKKLNIRLALVSENVEYVTGFVRNENQILINEENENQILNKNIKQIMFIGEDKGLIKSFQKSILNKFDINIIDSSNESKDLLWFSIVSKESSKGNALYKLAEYLNIQKNNIIAIGNDRNDISMINIANPGVAVSNATDELKNVADIIIKSNDEDGIYYFLKEWIEKI